MSTEKLPTDAEHERAPSPDVAPDADTGGTKRADQKKDYEPRRGKLRQVARRTSVYCNVQGEAFDYLRREQERTGARQGTILVRSFLNYQKLLDDELAAKTEGSPVHKLLTELMHLFSERLDTLELAVLGLKRNDDITQASVQALLRLMLLVFPVPEAEAGEKARASLEPRYRALIAAMARSLQDGSSQLSRDVQRALDEQQRDGS